MKNSVIFIVFLCLSFVFSVFGADLAILRDGCLSGAQYTAPGEDYLFKIHAKKSRLRLLEFLEGATGTVVVLGPGPAYDLPLIDFVTRFEKVILIDGAIDAVKAWKKSLIPSLRSKVHIVEQDLSGGMAAFLANFQDEIIRAMRADIRALRRGRQHTLKHFEQLILQQKFYLDISRWQPDVVVSSLVTSQTQLVFKDAIDRWVKRALQREGEPLNGHVAMFCFGTASCTKKDQVHQTYISAIVNSGAKKIYYADTNHREKCVEEITDLIEYEELVSSSLIDSFVATMKSQNYKVCRKNFAWDYHQSDGNFTYDNSDEGNMMLDDNQAISDNDAALPAYRLEEMPVSWITFESREVREQGDS